MVPTYEERRDEMRHVEWHTLFADRSAAQQTIHSFLSNLNGRYSKPEFPILQFYGLSGQGKTSLFRRAQETLAPGYKNVRCAFVELEVLESTRVREVIEVLWHLTEALAKAGIFAPLTLCLYAHYWKKQNAGQEFRLHETPLKDYLKECSEHCIRSLEILASSDYPELLHHVFDFGSGVVKGWTLIEKLWSFRRDLERLRRIKDLRGTCPDEWNMERIEGSFPEFLAVDIFSHFQDHANDQLCIVMDTFERLQPEDGTDKCEGSFADLCRRLVAPPRDEFRGRTGVLLFGREEIKWKRYDAPYTPDPWQNYIQTIHLEGFSEPDAKTFLRDDYRNFWVERKSQEVGEELAKYETAILAASGEQTDHDDGERTYLPYFLRLAGEMIYEQGERFVPEMLGRSPDEMQQRFLRFLRERSPHKIRALQTLALALYFDQSLFQHLVREQHIQGIPIQSFLPALVGSRSYVVRIRMHGTEYYRFHRHMQAALLDDLAKNELDVSAAAVSIDAILTFYANQAHFNSLAEYVSEKHLPPYAHAMDVLISFAERGWVDSQKASNWFQKLDASFDVQTAAPIRRPLWERMLPVLERALGAEHPDVAASLNNLAALYQSQGKYDEAERLYRRALANQEMVLGPAHPHVGTSLNNLAAVYQSQGKDGDAEVLYRRSLAIREKALGPKHPDVANSLNNLGEFYRRQGEYDEAERLYRRSLAIEERVLGPQHPDVAVSLNNLANLYHAQRKYDEAEPLLRRALAIKERALGPQHLRVATSLGSLAELYHNQGRYDEAEPFFRRALAVWEKALGPEHPNVATELNNLAGLYYDQGKYAAAEPLYQRALGILEKVRGPEHPDVATSLGNLALLYDSQGKSDEAEPLFRRALAVWEKALGPEHPDLIARLNKLAWLYFHQGKYGEAESLLRRSLGILEKVWGPEHPDLTTTLDNLALVYVRERKYGEAELLFSRSATILESALAQSDVATSLDNLATLFRRALEIREKVFGPEDPGVVASLDGLAVAYAKQGKYGEAEPLFCRGLAIREKVLGPENPGIASSLDGLAVFYGSQGKYDEAEPLFRRALEIREDVLGPEDPDVATSLKNLAVLYCRQGEHGEAEPLFQRALAIWENALGPEHPNTEDCRKSLRMLEDEMKRKGQPPSSGGTE